MIDNHLLSCLADYVLDKPFNQRRPFLDRFEKRNGQRVTDKLKEMMFDNLKNRKQKVES